MSKDSIKLSKKHGVNPSLDICFFCGESKGVALLGKLPNDAEAPKEIITDYEPCNKCKEQWKKGIPIIGVSKTPMALNQPPLTIQDNTAYYPTGQYALVKPEALAPDAPFKPGQPTIMDREEFEQTFNIKPER